MPNLSPPWAHEEEPDPPEDDAVELFLQEPSSSTSQIVPPYMDEDWRLMRARLDLAGAHCYAAAKASTTEEVRAQTGLAMADLLDGIFVLGRITRKDEPDGD